MTAPPEEDEQTPPEEETPPEETEEEEPDTFPRSYVESLRGESAAHRTAAREANEALLAAQQRLHGLLVAGSGRLADPTDLPFVVGHLDDEAALTAAIDDLLARKPHLASRRVRGDVNQGARGTAPVVDLAGLLRRGA